MRYRHLLPLSLLAMLAPAARAEVIAHWSFDAGTVTTDAGGKVTSAADSSPVARHASTVANGSGAISSTPAQFGAGITFSNAPNMQATNNAYMSFANLTELMGASGGDYSIAAWFTTPNTSSSNTILADWGNAPPNTHRFDYWFSVTNFGSVRGQARAANAPPDPATIDIYGFNIGSGYNDNDWHHAVWTWNKTARRFRTYIDGGLAASVVVNPASVDLMVSDSPIGTIGRKGDTHEYFVGSLDEVWVFSEELSGGNVFGLHAFNDPTVTPEPASLAALATLAPLALRRPRSKQNCG